MEHANWFIGWPADDWNPQEAVTASQNALNLPPDSRWMLGDDLHVTLAFLGPCGSAAAHVAFDLAVRQSTDHPAALTLWAKHWALLGHPKAPSAVSIIMRDQHDQIDALISNQRGPICAAAGVRPDERPPKPHVTVARLSRRQALAKRMSIASELDARAAGDLSLQLKTLSLFTWTEERDRRLFQRVRTVPLGESLT